MAEAYFTRKETEGGVEFTITRAGIASSAMGCVTLLAFGSLVPLLAYPLLIGFDGKSGAAGYVPILAMSAAAWAFHLYGKERNKSARKPVVVLVGPDGITASGQRYAAADIAEVVLLNPNTGKSVVMDQFTNMEREHANQSFAVAIRTRSDSRPTTIVQNMTYDPARLLVDELASALRIRCAWHRIGV